MNRAASLLVLSALLGGAAACTQEPVEVSLRSLERSGAVAFVCMGDPAKGPVPRSASACTAEEAEGIEDFDRREDEEGAPAPEDELPHLYAFVAQTTRGELAMVDLTADDGNVLDQDGSTPGPNHLPIGADPVDVVASPGGTAVFVTSAEAGRPAIYAIPTRKVRPCGVDESRCGVPAPTLSSWPVCTLPAAPGDAVIAFDPPDASGATRASCDGGGADASTENGDLGLEGKGRQKLIVALPTLGQLVVLDAQTLLGRAPNDLSACVIERTLDLATEVPLGDTEPPYPDGDACVVPDTIGPRAEAAYVSTPSSLWYAEGDDRLYAGDLTAPLVHVLDAASACDLRELPPLLATSREDPRRVVATTRVAASQRLAPGFKRYVYAVDVEDRSLMVFDVSDDAGSREPLRRPNPELNPLQPVDRLRFGAAPRDLIVVERDEPETLPASGTAEYGTRCNPDPAAVVCDSGVTTCDPGTLYRTSGDKEEGAGPFTLRGTFAFVALSDGRVSVIDIDDYDADCRGPTLPSRFYGCDEESTPGSPGLLTSEESSCNVVVPHALRSAAYFASSDLVGRHQPGVTTFPLLYRKDGTVVEGEDDPAAQLVRMRALIPEPPISVPYQIAVGGEVLTIGQGENVPPDLVADGEGKVHHTLAMNLEEPRAHTSDQDWTITYEGPLPGLDGRVGDLQLTTSPGTFQDAAAQFCDQGVQSENAVREQLTAAGLTEAEIEAQAPALADRLSVTEPLPANEDPYWDGASCSFQQCLGIFGDEETPREARDIAILEAYSDHLVLAPPSAGVSAEEFECCFPTLIQFTVRAGAQWVAVGSSTGFLHHVVEDPETGVCRDSCDPDATLLRGRVRTAPEGPVEEGSPLAFRNPFFRFAITAPAETVIPRDHAFKFTTQGQFIALFASLTEETDNVLPQTLTYVPGTGELAVADGSLEGLLLVSTRTMQLERQFF